MSDISINISWLDLLLIFGWPGIVVGGVLGAVLWRRRRLTGAVVGALAGCVVWSAAALALKLL